MNPHLAALRLLVTMVKADGEIHPDERTALYEATSGLTLPDGITIDGLLAESANPDLDTLIAAITDDNLRSNTIQSLELMMMADGTADAKERDILDRARNAWAKPVGFFGRIADEVKDTVSMSRIEAIHDPERRAAEIKEDTIKYATLTAALGANPVPGLSIGTDLAGIAIQVKMIRDIGMYYGFPIDKEAGKNLMAAMGIGIGAQVARVALTNLLKVIPVVGSLAGAVSAFAMTYAIAIAAQRYFDLGGGELTEEKKALLRETLAKAKEAGKKAYEENKSKVNDVAVKTKTRRDELAAQVKEGKITAEQMAQELASTN